MSEQQDRQEIERLRESLQQRMKRVPDWVNSGSIQTVRDYKKRYAAASKLLDKKNATATDLVSAISAVS